LAVVVACATYDAVAFTAREVGASSVGTVTAPAGCGREMVSRATARASAHARVSRLRVSLVPLQPSCANRIRRLVLLSAHDHKAAGDRDHHQYRYVSRVTFGQDSRRRHEGAERYTRRTGARTDVLQ
jgi:hypothetical protein